ncbi:MAG: DUF4114 domain-containing protein [Deltaproteobacteria bacterium]|nr:DUF4114 domain-containing protein [Deltaproteobacteria bacterium]
MVTWGALGYGTATDLVKRAVVTLCALALAARASPSAAQVRQPDGTLVPDLGASMPSLQGYLNRRGEGAAGLDAVRNAAITPERFLPGCSIRFTVVGRDSGYANAFGWYNVTAGRAPTAAELFEFIPSTAPEGFTAALDFRSDTRYRGGEIGFFLRTPPGYVYYSERAYQPDRAATGGFIHLLIYDSRVTANAFYFAWEDLFGGGDNDFQDILMIVDNLVCAGGGDRCDTGELGVCATGVRQCRTGMLACVRVTGPGVERCDGLDNDCNAMVDDGMNLCPAMQVCDQGVCVDRCMNELGCPAGTACTPRGTCVETTCAAVTCPPESVCHRGMCRRPCEGVTCPRGQVCRLGRCVDPCAGVTCDGDQVCADGVCQTRCPCRRCPAGQSCYTDGRCRLDACAMVRCEPGFTCEEGRCRDLCEGASCPPGQACRLGRCAGELDGGAPDAAGTPDAARDAADGGSAPRDATALPDVPARDTSRGTPDTAAEPPLEDGSDGTCNCRAPGGDARGARGVLGALAVAAGVRRRRRR